MVSYEALVALDYVIQAGLEDSVRLLPVFPPGNSRISRYMPPCPADGRFVKDVLNNTTKQTLGSC